MTQPILPPAPPRVLDAPMNSEEIEWWRRERPKVLARQFALFFLVAGGFSALAGFTRPFFTRAGRVDILSALVGALVGAGIAAVGAAVLVLADGGIKERDRLLRERRLRDALLE